MRVISQDGTLDVPYELTSIQLVSKTTIVAQGSYFGSGNDNFATIAEYSTEEKAKKAMEMLRIAYGNNEFYHHTGNSEHFVEFCQSLSREMFNKSTSEYFQFPTEEELE